MAKMDWDEAVRDTRAGERITPLAYTIKDAVKLTGMSRSRLYEELKAGRLTAKKAGRSTLIPRESLEIWLENLDNYAAATTASNFPRLTP